MREGMPENSEEPDVSEVFSLACSSDTSDQNHARSSAVLASFVQGADQLEGLDEQRAVSLSTALTGFGKHFKAKQATAADFALSFNVRRYTTFVSHSWQTGRALKYLAFLYQHSLIPAMVASMAVALATALLQVFWILPPVTWYPWDEFSTGKAPLFIGCQVLGPVAFVLTLVLWVKCCSFFSCLKFVSDSRLFIDKLCIDQQNDAKKQKGIDGIGARLRNSDQMLVLWDPTYFTRLWCCFEFALFLHRFQRGLQSSSKSKKGESCTDIGFCVCGCCSDNVPKEVKVPYTEDDPRFVHDKFERPPMDLQKVLEAKAESEGSLQAMSALDKAFKILPLQQSFMAFAIPIYAWQAGFVYNLLFLVPGVSSFFPPAWMACSIYLACLGGSKFGRAYCIHRDELSEQLGNFTVSAANCSLESDRATIVEVIQTLYAGRGGNGIKNFEAFVRRAVKDVTITLLGPVTALPARLAFAVTMFTVFSHVDSLCSFAMLPVASLKQPEERWTNFVMLAGRYFAMGGTTPAGLVLALGICRVFQRKRTGVAEHCANLVVTVGTTIPFTLCFATPMLVGRTLDVVPGVIINSLLAVMGLGGSIWGQSLPAVLAACCRCCRMGKQPR
eukprot:gb/GFBE01025156.1/.p1 GENE.gb/GFBE01025156.1/~~gb/GFBE01025156.1/.p1  ORF type:complete len:615 (+),score=87.78 gb/GFBE01025156.1/:1-1845(+)